MKINFTIILMLAQTAIIVVLFIVLVLVPKPDKTGEMIKQNKLLLEQTQKEVQQANLQILKTAIVIDSLQGELRRQTEIEQQQEQNLTTILKNIKHLKNDRQIINFSDSSNNTVFKFLTNRIPTGDNK